MNVGDLVLIKKPHFIAPEDESRVKEGQHGIIVDILEMEDGFFEYEVLFENEVDWFSDLELKIVINDS